MEEHQIRVIDERDELTKKIVKLSTAMNNGILYKVSITEQQLLIDQLEVMKNYLHILERRIALFIRS